MFYLGLVADALNVIDDVVGIFLQRVVDAGFEIRLRAVVVDAQPAADIQVLQTGAGALQFDVDARCLRHRGLDLPDIGDLTAQVEMEQFEAVLHAGGLHLLQRLQRLAHGQAELRAITARRLPPARPFACQLQPQSDHRPHTDALRVLQDQIQLGVLLHHRDDLPADLLGQHHHLDVLVVFEAVADDGRVVIGHRQHRQQLRFRAGLQPEMVRAAELENLLDHLPLLVHLDRINAAVSALVAVLGDRILERLVQFAQTMLQDFGEADQDRQRNAAQLQFFDQLAQIDGSRGFLGRMHPQMPVRADGKIALAPTGDVVQLAGICNGPSFGRFPNGSFAQFQFVATSELRINFQCPAIRLPEGKLFLVTAAPGEPAGRSQARSW